MARPLQQLPPDQGQWEQDIRNAQAAAEALLQAYKEREAFSSNPTQGRTALRGMLEQALQYADALCQPSRPRHQKSLVELAGAIHKAPKMESEHREHGPRYYTSRQRAVDAISQELMVSAEALEARATPKRLLNGWTADFNGMSNMDFELTTLTNELPNTTELLRQLAMGGAMESLVVAIEKRDQPYVARAASGFLGRLTTKGGTYDPQMVHMLKQLADPKLDAQTYQEVCGDAKEWFSKRGARIVGQFDTKKLTTTYRNEVQEMDASSVDQLYKEAPQTMGKLSCLYAAEALRQVHGFVYDQWHAVERLYPPEISRDGRG